ncbi:Splicing factor u2af subunit-like protein [Thalictrum thalictroides]|uniref:Splicing factor u2af subunit-like protein n=1 Tax=Thalictrum thalictroides TaxID=46969 RepID=A0A7J6WZS6_THATH|nr:Splicing factor u2af subunit-like protein [Thalictrum thalictroides]
MERAAKKAQEEEEESQRKLLQEESCRHQAERENELKEDDDEWEYEEGTAEVIFQGNEIIVKKKRVKVAKRRADNQQACIEDASRPTSNPLPPQSEAYGSYRNTSVSDHQVFESVSQQTPNFGTEQDKAHCPFHIKTGACRFGVRCSRVHFYPDKSCTLLIKNMYSGPGLTWEQDEGLEHTDEEIDRSYEEFYEDVHTEFLKFGEIVNFKVCKNGSVHLRGNVYVHFKSLESAILAYQSINGRYYAGKQITCEYVGVTRWRIAICGEYMKSRFKNCSRGTACNFIHCFRNPGGDYEWADWDNPPPKYWVKKMVALLGPSDECGYDQPTGKENWSLPRNSNKRTSNHERYYSRRSRTRDHDSLSSSDGDDPNENRDRWDTPSNPKKDSFISNKVEKLEQLEDNSKFENDRYEEDVLHDHRDHLIKDSDRYYSNSRAHSRCHSKGQDHHNSDKSVLRKYSSNEHEHYERKDKLRSHDSSRKYNYLSSRREHGTGQKKTKAIHDKQTTSENCESDSVCSHGGRSKSRDLRPNSKEVVDPCGRWETGSGSSCHDDSEKSGCPGFNDNELCQQRHWPHDERYDKRCSKSRSKSQSQSRHRAPSNHSKDERYSSSESLHLKEDLHNCHGKHHFYNSHKKANITHNQDNNESLFLGESGGELDVGRQRASDLLLHESSNHRKEQHRHRSDLKKDQSKKAKDRTKRRRENTEKDENIESELVSWKRTRCSSPA